MIIDLQDLQTITERLGRIEKENRLLKRIGLVLLSVVAVAFVMGQARPARTLEATAFILKDETGMVRAKLFMDPTINGPSLSLYDSKGQRRVWLNQNSKRDAEGLILYSDPPEQYGSAQVLLTPDGASLNLLSAKLKGGILLATNSIPGPALEIVDAKGFSANVGVGELDVPATGEKRTTSAASIILHDKNGKVIWSAP